MTTARARHRVASKLGGGKGLPWPDYSAHRYIDIMGYRVCVLIGAIACGCAVRAPLTEGEVATVILGSKEFNTPGKCRTDVAAKRELVAVIDAAPVTCESSLPECHTIARFRWRWRSVDGQFCNESEKQSWVDLYQTSGQQWRLVKIGDSP